MRITLRPGVIYAYCKAQNISRDELSRQIGVNSTTTFRIERGDYGPSPKFIAGLMYVTGWDFEALFEIQREQVAS